MDSSAGNSYSGLMASMTPPHIVILAGGAGKRMRIPGPKALHPVFFRPMIHHMLDAASAIAHRSLCLVVGRDEREFREQCRGYADLRFFRQESPLGTADALLAAEPALAQGGDVLVLNADTVLLSARTLRELLAKHAEAGAACTVGRAEPDGEAVAWCFRVADLFGELKRAGPRGPGQELALEDAVVALAAEGVAAAEYLIGDPLETLDINDLRGLWRVETVLQERYNLDLMLRGVALQDPRTTLIDPRCRIDADVRIEGGCTVIDSVLERGARVESFCRILGCEIGPDSVLLQGTIAEQSRLGRGCRVGPYARLCPGTQLEDGVRVGSFSELGEAQVGRNAILGAGFIACSASGRPLKQKTIIEDGVFVGGACQAIAPVTLGAGSFVATGTSVTEDVPPDSFVIGRSRQVVKPGYSKRHGKTKSPAAPR